MVLNHLLSTMENLETVDACTNLQLILESFEFEIASAS